MGLFCLFVCLFVVCLFVVDCFPIYREKWIYYLSWRSPLTECEIHWKTGLLPLYESFLSRIFPNHGKHFHTMDKTMEIGFSNTIFPKYFPTIEAGLQFFKCYVKFGRLNFMMYNAIILRFTRFCPTIEAGLHFFQFGRLNFMMYNAIILRFTRFCNPEWNTTL